MRRHDQLREVMDRCADAGLIDAADVSRLAVQWRAVSHGLAEFENHGVITDGDDSWRRVLAALIDGYSATGQDARE